MTPTLHRNSLEAVLRLARGDVSQLKEDALCVYEPHRNVTVDEAVKLACLDSLQLAPMLGASPIQLAHEYVPFYGALYMWARDSFPHFTLSPDFFEAIATTDFGDPTDEPLYMPFDCFTVSFPKSSRFNNASRAMVYRIPRVDGDVHARQTDDFTVNWNMYRATLMTDDPIFTQWGIGMTRRQLLELAPTLNSSVADAGVRPVEPEEAPLLERLRTMLANMLSYIEAAGPLPTERRKKGAEPAPVERTHGIQPNFDVGRTVRLDGGLRQAMQATAGDAGAWKLAQRFIVRGHWRNQAHGEGRSLRKRIWVAPFWKGPTNVIEALSRTYEVA